MQRLCRHQKSLPISMQERRTAVALRIKCRHNRYQLVVNRCFFFHRFKLCLLCFVLPDTCPELSLPSFGEKRRRLSPWGIDLSAPSFNGPCPAPRSCQVPPRMSALLIQQVWVLVMSRSECLCFHLSGPTCRIQNPDMPQAGRVGVHGGGGGAAPARTGRRQNISPRRRASLVPSKASKTQTRLLNVSPEARTSEILCKPMAEHNERLTTG